MKRYPRLARRYGAALCEVAIAREEVDRVEAQLGVLVDVLASHPELRRQLSHRQRPLWQRKALLDGILAEALAEPPLPIVRNFLHLLIDKRREEYLEEIVAEFRRRADAARGVVEAVARVAVPLNEVEEATLRRRLGELTGKQVRLSIEVDPDLIGGVMLRIGDRVLDDTVRARLARLRTALARAPLN